MQAGLLGLYSGVVTYREDPELRGRIKVRVPGVLEPEAADHGPWALPRGGGAPQWGHVSVPPLGAAVWVQFVGGDVDQPVWEPGWYSAPDKTGDGAAEIFPEHEHPDVHVWGLGPFRLVVDLRAGQERATLKMIHDVNGEETPTGWVLLDAAGNGIQVYADSAVEVSALALVNVAGTVVQVHDRKVVPNGRAID
jgi:uncharacterized protein involved in type VI secretion and phage assembly